MGCGIVMDHAFRGGCDLYFLRSLCGCGLVVLDDVKGRGGGALAYFDLNLKWRRIDWGDVWRATPSERWCQRSPLQPFCLWVNIPSRCVVAHLLGAGRATRGGTGREKGGILSSMFRARRLSRVRQLSISRSMFSIQGKTVPYEISRASCYHEAGDIKIWGLI